MHRLIALALALSLPVSSAHASGQLDRFVRQLRDEVRAAHRAAPGMRPLPPAYGGGEVGRDVVARRYPLPTRPTVAARVHALAHRVLRPSPDDLVFYADVAPITTLAEIEASFAIEGERLSTRERAKLRALFELIAREARSRGLELHRLQAGWADAVGSAHHGVVVLEPGGDVAYWVRLESVWYEG